MRRLHAALCGLVLLGCSEAGEVKSRFGTEVVSLVDLSATWHNAESRGVNHRVMESVDAAIRDATRINYLDMPLQHLVYEIGATSFNLQPICETVFRTQITGTAEGSVSKIEDFAIIQDECRKKILSRPQAPLTDITGAIDTVSRGRTSEQVETIVIVMSDFAEDRGRDVIAGPGADLGDLTGMDFILLYRQVAGEPVAEMDVRLEAWREALSSRGGRVLLTLPDSQASATRLAPYIGVKR